MNVKDAIVLMAKHPAVGFPWEETLVSLVNGFLPAESQLDPNTASASEVQVAIDSLEVTLQEMVYASHIGPAQTPYTPPPVVQPPPVIAPVQVVDSGKTIVFWMFGAGICICAVLLALRVGDGASSADVVELLKLAISLISDKAPADVPPPE